MRDKNILEIAISDSLDQKGNKEVIALLTIGDTNSEINEHLESLSEEDLKNENYNFPKQYEIMLTKENLKQILCEIEKEEKYILKNGRPSYVN